MTGRKTEESGQSLVECAIILPLLVLVMSVVIEFGWIIMNRMNFDNMALVAVHANAKTDSGQAADFLEKYVRDNFDRFDDSSLTVSASTEVQTYYYDEYVWKSNQHKHWQVPMYFYILHTEMDISYEMPYLTPMGKVLFQDTDNTMTLTTKTMASRALANDSVAAVDGGDDGD